jgi:hypothetical protein
VLSDHGPRRTTAELGENTFSLRWVEDGFEQHGLGLRHQPCPAPHAGRREPLYQFGGRRSWLSVKSAQQPGALDVAGKLIESPAQVDLRLRKPERPLSVTLARCGEEF